MGLCLLAFSGTAQVIFYVQAPSPNEGNYDFTYADDAAADWSVPDMDDPGNAILAEAVLIDDESGLDNPIGCDEIMNDLSDKIAVLYRGTCEFGTKALNAQEAGAIGVIIINNLGGEPVAMGGGADGGGVTIPVVMISNINGALLRDEIDAGGLEIFIGSKNGLYTNDLGFTAADHFRAKSFGVLQQLAQDGTEFEVDMGSWVRNYGTADQTGVVLEATIDLGGSELYNESSDPVTLEAGDSIFIPLPTFSQGSYANGYYEVIYSLYGTEADDSPFDNDQNADFVINESYFSMAALAESTMIPVNSTNQFNGTTDNLFSCLFFQDENASRVGLKGLNFSAGTSQNPDPTSLDGQFFEVYIYEWNDEWVDLDDPDFNISALEDIADAEYNYIENLQSENVYISLEEPVILEDNQKYMFCVQLYGTDIYPGYDTKTDYNWNVEEYRMPTSPLFLSGQWYALGYGTDRNPSISAEFFNASELSIVEVPEVELKSFPNPANEVIHIPMKPVDGEIILTIHNMSGQVVSTQNVTMEGARLDVDASSLSAGMYVINLDFEDGKRGTLNVVISH